MDNTQKTDESKQVLDELKSALDEFEKKFYSESILDKVKKRIRRIKHRIQTVWKFVKLGWDDYDWDQYYLLRMLEVKLQGMYDFFDSDCVMCEGSNKKAEEIKSALDACRRLVENEYEPIALEPHDKKWGKVEVSFEEIEGSKCTRLVHKRKNVKTPEDEKQEQEEFKQCYNEAQKAYEKDAEILFDTMKKCHQGWWD